MITLRANSLRDFLSNPDIFFQLNLPFCVATFLLEGDVFVKQFTPDCVDNEARIDLSRRVEVIHDPEITALGAKFRHKVRVDVYFKNGAIESETREAPIGWFETEKEFQNYADKFKIEHRASAGDLKAARTTLKLSSVVFADKISVGRPPNTQNKFVF